MLAALTIPIASANTGTWVRQGTSWFYEDEYGNRYAGGRYFIEGTWYFFHDNGVMATGWNLEGITWRYYHTNGAMATGTVNIDGVTYTFAQSGALITDMEGIRNGWHQQNELFYFYRNGVLQQGWQLIGSDWYYFNPPSGAMATGWFPALNISAGTRYFLHADGRMATGWHQIGNNWYYFHPTNGAMATGWLLLGTSWYFLNNQSSLNNLPTGARLTGAHRINGIMHEFNAHGVWQGQAVAKWNGWYQENGDWYFYRNGVGLMGWHRIGNHWYHFGVNPENGQAGFMQTLAWVYDEKTGDRFFVGADGIMVTGWVFYEDHWYFLNAAGIMTRDAWVRHGGFWYYFGSDGIMLADEWLRDSTGMYFLQANGAMATG